MTLSELRSAAVAEARRILTDPAICAADPQLGQQAWCFLKKLSGHPVVPPRHPRRRRPAEVAS